MMMLALAEVPVHVPAVACRCIGVLAAWLLAGVADACCVAVCVMLADH